MPKTTKSQLDFYVAEFLTKPRECQHCSSRNTEPETELTHVCLDCGAKIYLDNLPPTPEDEDDYS